MDDIYWPEGWRTPEPVPDIDLGLCARIVELEAKVRTANTQLQNAVRENNRLRAESRHQHGVATRRAERIFELQRELAIEREDSKTNFEYAGDLEEERDDLAAALDAANEKLAQIEEALEDPWHAGDAIRSILES